MKIKSFTLTQNSDQSINKFLSSVYVKDVKFSNDSIVVLYFEFTKSVVGSGKVK